MGIRSCNTPDLLKEGIGMFRGEITVIFICPDAHYILSFIGFRMKLGSINVVFDPKHLHRTAV